MRTELDPDRLPLTLLQLYKIKEGELLSALIHVGSRLDLWAGLAEHGPCTSGQLAAATGLPRRSTTEPLST